MSEFYVEHQHWTRFPKVLLMKKKTGYGNITRRYVPERKCHVEGGYYDEVMECFYTQLSCGHEVDKHERDFDYCPNCGAKVVKE